MLGTGPSDRRGDADALPIGGRREGGPKLGPAGVDRPPAAGLGVGDGDEAGVRQSQVAPVDELDRDDVVSLGQPGEGSLPRRRTR